MIVPAVLKTRAARRAAAVAAVLVTAAAAGGIFWWNFEPMHLRIRLLCKTDHQALREVCRELAGQVTAGKLVAGTYRIRPWASPSVSRFPRTVRALGPSYVYIDEDGRVMVEMFGGLSHFGVYVYPEGYQIPFQGFKYGDRELIPDLWYYDDEYHKDPNYDAVITKILRLWR